LTAKCHAQIAMGTRIISAAACRGTWQRAAHWFREAAKGGDTGGDVLAASMYEQGDGVERDLGCAPTGTTPRVAAATSGVGQVRSWTRCWRAASLKTRTSGPGALQHHLHHRMRCSACGTARRAGRGGGGDGEVGRDICRRGWGGVRCLAAVEAGRVPRHRHHRGLETFACKPITLTERRWG